MVIGGYNAPSGSGSTESLVSGAASWQIIATQPRSLTCSRAVNYNNTVLTFGKTVLSDSELSGSVSESIK